MPGRQIIAEMTDKDWQAVWAALVLTSALLGADGYTEVADHYTEMAEDIREQTK